MKRLLLVVLALSLSVSAQMWPMPGPGSATNTITAAAGFSVLHSYTLGPRNTNTAATVTITATTAGSGLLYHCINNNGHDFSSITGSPTKLAGAAGPQQGYQAVYFQPNVAAGTTSITFTPSAYDDHMCEFWEVAGVATASPLDVASSIAASPWGTSLSFPAVTTTNGNDVVLGFAKGVPTQTYTALGGYTPMSARLASATYSIWAEYLVVSTTGSKTPTATAGIANYTDMLTIALKLQ